MRVNFTYLIGPQKGLRKSFETDRITIGRAANNVFTFGEDQRRVSAHHAEVSRMGDQWLLRDLGSTNGTMINGRRVTIAELQHDDMIEVGAGGPLLRFALEQDASMEPRAEAALTSNPRTEIARRPIFLRQHRNTVLVGALCAAMLIGALVGSFASARIRAREPDDLSFAEIAELNSPAVVFIRTEFEILDAAGNVA